MEVFTQTSACGCSRKNSTVSHASRHLHQHQRRHSLRSLALQPVALDMDTADSSSISLASLHIQGLRPPAFPSSPASETGEQRGCSDYSYEDRAGSGHQNGSDYMRDSRGAAAKNSRDAKDAGSSALKVRGGLIPRSHATDSQAVSRNGLDSVSQDHASDLLHGRSQTAPPAQNVGIDSSRERHCDSNLGDNIVTNGHFVSRRPPPAARSKPDVQQQRRGRERCRSGVAPSASQQGRKGTSAVQARRGRSAGDIKYCGRPCDACSLQKIQQWAKGQTMEEHDTGDTSQKLYVMECSNGHRKHYGSSGQLHAAAAPVTTVSVPGWGLPKLTGLKHELADPSYYERQRQDLSYYERQGHQTTSGHKGSRQDSRLALLGPRTVSVVRNPDMLRHVRQGSQLLHAQPDNLQVLAGDCDDLLETILLYEIPGVSKMKNDYTGLVERNIIPQYGPRS